MDYSIRTNPSKYEGVIRHIARQLAHRNKASAKRHLKRILPHYNDMTPAEQDVVDALRLRLF